jgi:glycine cleavage system H lipoate-binding protein
MSIASDPYGAGWLIKIRVPAGTKLDHLMSLDQYEKQIAEEQH